MKRLIDDARFRRAKRLGHARAIMTKPAFSQRQVEAQVEAMLRHPEFFGSPPEWFEGAERHDRNR